MIVVSVRVKYITKIKFLRKYLKLKVLHAKIEYSLRFNAVKLAVLLAK